MNKAVNEPRDVCSSLNSFINIMFKLGSSRIQVITIVFKLKLIYKEFFELDS